MVRKFTLTDFSIQRTVLLNTVAKKISSKKFNALNEEFDDDLKIDLNAITTLVEAIFSRVRNAEMIYHTFLESVDHNLLIGASSGLPFDIDVEFQYNTGTISNSIRFDDRQLYKEAIDSNFQHFILSFAAVYENIVKLSELLVKKIIIHHPKSKPQSTPLHHYVKYFQLLIGLGYRRNDKMYTCIATHTTFLDRYLEIMNSLRNRYIHGFMPHLISDGSNYRINHQLAQTKFTSVSPELNIDQFSRIILENSRLFFSDLFDALILHIKHPSKYLPA